MKVASLYFTAPREVEIREEDLPSPEAGQVLVEVSMSAISAGTELLVYRGQFPPDLKVDESIPALSGAFAYPLCYGYSTVGRVMALGDRVDPVWAGREVFAFQPHANRFVAPVEALMPLPAGLGVEEALFLPNMETAVNLLLDGRPLVGERVVVFGQGVLGLLTTALLRLFPLTGLVTLDRYPSRQLASLALGVTACLDPLTVDWRQHLQLIYPDGADLTYELSGSPEALDQAIYVTGYSGRVVLGSWYGQKRASLDLGGRFHRQRIHLLSSQVSSIAPELSARWDKARRISLAWDMLARVRPSRWITHRFRFEEANEAYRLLDEAPEEAIQVILTYADRP